MVVLGYGMTLDVQDLPFATLDGDQSPESRDYVQRIAGSRYFVQRPPIRVPADLDRRLKSGELAVAIEIPPASAGTSSAGVLRVAAWVDGAMPFRGETVRGYVQGVHYGYLAGLGLRGSGAAPQASWSTSRCAIDTTRTSGASTRWSPPSFRYCCCSSPRS